MLESSLILKSKSILARNFVSLRARIDFEENEVNRNMLEAEEPVAHGALKIQTKA